jgi:Protein of unknown function (DUF3916)
MTRQIAISNKKLRGIPRRMRAIESWAKSFENFYPQFEDRYWNWKLPVHRHMVEGKQSKPYMKQHCAQQLINATHNIFKTKPIDSKQHRVTCTISQSMFSSEICIFNSADYYSSFINTGKLRESASRCIDSIVNMLNLDLPTGFNEIGIEYLELQDDNTYTQQRYWLIGELAP